jgi:hypothetical protein
MDLLKKKVELSLWMTQGGKSVFSSLAYNTLKFYSIQRTLP